MSSLGIHNWVSVLNGWSATWAVAMVRACWQSAPLFVLAWGVSRLFPFLPPSVRAWGWRLVYLKLLCVFLWSGSVNLPLLPPQQPDAHAGAITSSGGVPGDGTSGATGATTPARSEWLPALMSPGAAQPSAATWLLAAWLAGVVWYGANVMRQWRWAQRLRGKCRPIDDAELRETFATLAWCFDLAEVPRFLQVEGSGSPLAVGWKTPSIILPAQLLSGCTAPELRMMLAHELSHLQRRDLLWGWLPALGQTLFFFNPLVWMGNKEWRLAQEMACDEAALLILEAPLTDYGNVLLKVAAQCRPQPNLEHVTVFAVENHATLKTRLRALAGSGSHGRRRLEGVAVGALMPLLLILVPWKLVAQEAPPDLQQPELGLNANLHGKRPFPDDNVWNQRIDRLPVDPHSATLLQSIGWDQALHADFGTSLNGKPAGIPYVVVPGNAPKVPVQFTYTAQSDFGPYPIPAEIEQLQGDSQRSLDEVVVLDRDNWKLYEMWNVTRDDDGYKAECGAVFELYSNALRPAGWTSADGAGLPIFPGLARYDEIALGAIRHALRFTAPHTRRGFVYPARHFASQLTDPKLPPMGMRVRLKSSYDLSGFPPQARVILQALKTYGMFLAANGSPWAMSGTPDKHWDDADLGTLGRIKGKDLEVVSMGPIATAPVRMERAGP